MKELRIPLKIIWFEMTKSGIKTEDYREINDYWIRRLIKSVSFFGGCHESFRDVPIDKIPIDNINLLHVKEECLRRDINFKTFDTNVMTLGYPKSANKERILRLEHKGIEIRTGNPEWGAEPNKRYFVIKHGTILP